MSQIVPPSTRPASGDPDPFRLGWKEERRELPDGGFDYVNVPLTLEDVLHPEENYKIMNGSRHEEERYYLWGVIRHRLGLDQHSLALSDQGVYWDDPTLKHHCPDIAVIFGVREPRDHWPSFHVAEEGVRPALIIEIVSPFNRPNDVVTKFEQYHRAGVPWYVIADRIQFDGPPTLIGYRHTPEGYVEFPPDEQGRLLLEPIGLKLGVKGDRLALYDAVTGEEQGDYDAVRRDLQAERQARQAAEEKAQAETEARQHAEEKVQSEAAAREAAEEKARAETEARQAAEEEVRGAAKARQAAEESARAEAEARRAAEEQARAAQQQLAALMERLRELEAQGRQPGGGDTAPAP